MGSNMVVISLDIGTTKICASAVDAESCAVLETVSERNYFIPSDDPYEKVQDPCRIVAASGSLIAKLQERWPIICAIEITGQMHGILYVDGEGNAVSPLYTWQDQSGNREYQDGKTYSEYLNIATGYPAATGFGLVTHFCHLHRGKVPASAVKICTIQDYIVMRLTGEKSPITHVTNAASLGFFRLETGNFDWDVIKALGISSSILPEVTDQFRICGKNRDGVPVCVAIGDNQASFLGSVNKTEECILVNVGTGSQVSIACEERTVITDLELRPYFNGLYLQVGAPLCGGKAYELLERFFQDVLRMAGYQNDRSLYPLMDEFLLKEKNLTDYPKVTTRFCGSRSNTCERGKIENISFDNFTPAGVMLGFLEGISRELFDLALPCLESQCGQYRKVIASGNGVRKNRMLVKALSNSFRLPVLIPAFQEEASYGAALFALFCSGRFQCLEDAQRVIKI